MNSSPIIPRHWWGKIIGAVLGLWRGGIFGILAGLLIGHLVDRFIAGIGGVRETRRLFFRTLFSTLGHLSKADGRVSEAEIAAAESLMQRLQLTDGERRLAIRCFNEGKASDYPLEHTLRAFARQTMMRHDLRHMLLEVLLDTAASDGAIADAERAVLERCCAALHIAPGVFASMWNARQSGQGRARSAPPPGAGLSLGQAYAALGIAESASDAEVKRAYRKLVGQYHPDRLVSRGLPEEMMETARKRVREINAAYDRLKAARGIK